MPLRNPLARAKHAEHRRSERTTELEAAIEQSRGLLELGESDEFTPVSPATWKRAASFLRTQNTVCSRLFQVPLPIPDINPADAGGIDLFWRLKRHQLLINFPSERFDPITYYGQNVGGAQTIAGRTTAQDERPDLVAWLTQKKA